MESRSGIINVLPKSILPSAVRPRLKKLFDEMDQLLFLDDTQELSVDRTTLMRIASNRSFIPTELRDIVLVETSKHLGRRVKELARGRRIPWREGEKYGLPIHPLSESDLHEWGITERTSTDDLATIVRSHFPEIPAFWMNDNPKQLYETLVKRFKENRTVWDCLVANLGFWAALTFVGGLIIFLIMLGSGVPWPVALLIAGIYQSVATTYFLLQCAANPSFQQ